VNIDSILGASYNKVKIERLLTAFLFVFFLYTSYETQEVFKL
jgi:hypothetical protein